MNINLSTRNEQVCGVQYIDYHPNNTLCVKDYLQPQLDHDTALQALFTQAAKQDTARVVIGEHDLANLAKINTTLEQLVAQNHTIICEIIDSQSIVNALQHDKNLPALVKKLCLLSDVLIADNILVYALTSHSFMVSDLHQKNREVTQSSRLNTLIINNNGKYFYIDNATQAEFDYQQPSAQPLTCGALSAAFTTFYLHHKRPCDAITLALAMLNQTDKKAWPDRLSCFAKLNSSISADSTLNFKKTDTLSLGLYPVVDTLEWLEKLLKLGIKTIQLRIKDVAAETLDKLVAQASLLGKQYQARLFINDYWQLAIKHQCYGVHLGQEDLDETDLTAIAQAGLRLGISTHSEFEWLRAISIKPSYIAMGTVYTTQTKPAILIGLNNLKRWSKILADDYPIVAIGGISIKNIDPVLACGVGSIAVVTAITLADDYKQATLQLQEKQQQQIRIS